MNTQQDIDAELYTLLKNVSDPEIPVLSIVDMGVVRSAKVLEGKRVKVEITPTYSGCPAMDVIGDDVRKAFQEKGYIADVKLILSPAWTTDWMTEEAKQALKAYGIAPPLEASADKEALLGNKKIVECPQCGSTQTRLVSQFASTACKAMFQCEACQEPFDYFKCLI